MHRAVRALAALVGLERRDQVLRALVVQLRHRVGRVHVLVVRDRVAAVAGVGERRTALDVADGWSLGPRRGRREKSDGKNRERSDDRNAQIHTYGLARSSPGKTGRDIKDLGAQLPPGTIRFGTF